MWPLLLLAASLAAQVPDNPAALSGRVMNARTQEPVRKAIVRLQPLGAPGQVRGPGDVYESTADSGGAFVFDGIAPGRYLITSEKPGFVRGYLGPAGTSPSGGGIVTLEAGEDSRDLIVRMMPQAVVTGRIADEDGDPIQSATVTLFRSRFLNGRRQLLPSFQAPTNDLGEYRLAGITEGRYYVGASRQTPLWSAAASYPGPRTVRKGPEEGYVATFYPNAVDPRTVTTIDVEPGSEIGGIDMQLRRVFLYRVRGTVRGAAEGDTVQGITAFLYPDNGDFGMNRANQRPAPVNPRDGSFEVRGVQPGAYVLVATQYGHGRQRTGRAAVRVGEGDADGVEITLRESISLEGKIEYDGAGQLPLFGMVLQFLGQEASVRGGSPVNLAPDGSFTTPPLEPDVWRPSLNGLPEGLYLKAVQYAGSDVTAKGIDLTSGTAAGPLRLLVASGAAVLEGAVTNEKGEPVANAAVSTLPPEEWRGWPSLFRMVRADQSGRFRILGLPPGSYRLFAWDTLDDGEQQDPDLLERYEQRSVSVTLERNGGQAVVLRAIERGRR